MLALCNDKETLFVWNKIYFVPVRSLECYPVECSDWKISYNVSFVHSGTTV